MVLGLVEPSKVTWATTWWTPGVVGTRTVRGCPPTRAPLTVIVTFLIRLPRTPTFTPPAPTGPWTIVAVPPPVFALTVVGVPFFFFAAGTGLVPAGVTVVVAVPLPASPPDPLPTEHWGAVSTSLISVTSPLRARRRPRTARTLPSNAVVVPKVAELPTFQ